MKEFNEIQEDFNNHRDELATHELEWQKAKAELAKISVELTQNLANVSANEWQSVNLEFEQKKKNVLAKIDSIQKKIDVRKLNIEALKSFNPIDSVSNLKGNFPILMFPLRLETRFKKEGNKDQLWLRVYPDDCNINKKEDLPSKTELVDVQNFWIEMWKAGSVEVEERGAWRSLVNSYGSGRANWLIEHYKPLNIDKKPIKPTNEYKILVVVSNELLTDEELNTAKNYWAKIWLSNGDSSKINQANETLNGLDEAKKNKVLAFKPINLDDLIPEKQKPEEIKIEQIKFPITDIPQNVNTWNKAPTAQALPDRFVVVLYKGNVKRNQLFENSVKENLSVGIDPTVVLKEQINEHKKVIVDKKSLFDLEKFRKSEKVVLNDELNWMIDFDVAVNVGMATKIDLINDEANTGFDKLFVVGIKCSSDEKSGQKQLEKLFTNHSESKSGFSFLKQGTPTNNTEDEPAGYSWIENTDESYDRIFKGIENLTENSDGQKFADSLGINADILKNVPNANGKDQLEAIAMNTALFPATLGYFMNEMMTPLFSEEDITNTKEFMANFVSGRGPLPAICIGKQPYGILSVTVYSKMRFSQIHESGLATTHGQFKKTYIERLFELLNRLDKTWEGLAKGVDFVGKIGSKDPHKTLLNVVALNANSVEWHQRIAQSFQQLLNQLSFQNSNEFYEKVIKSLILTWDFMGEFGNLPILKKYFLSDPKGLRGTLVDDVPNSEINPIQVYSNDGKNYIEWLATSNAEKIRTENFGNPAPNALLYLLLRHSLMLAQANSASQFWISTTDEVKRSDFYDPNFLYIDGKGKSKFELLFNPNPEITGDANLSLVDFIYSPRILLESIETIELRQTIEALKILQKTPTARLERLLVEHLDCCNYRLDAWITGLVQYKLTEQRNKETTKKGVYLGTYGWLLDVKPKRNKLSDKVLNDELASIFNPNDDKKIFTDTDNLGYIHAPSLNQASAAAILRNAYDSNKGKGEENPFAINLTSERVRIANNFLEGMRNGQTLGALLGYQFERGLHDRYKLGEVDALIYPLRKVFPLVADNILDTKTESDTSIKTVGASNVMDGLQLVNQMKKSNQRTFPFGLESLTFLNNPPTELQEKAINDEANRIFEICDAISDLGMAEQVYQVVQGNFERASGVADSLSKGTYPPEMDIINTPRSGTNLTHRLVIHFDSNAVGATTPRAILEPSVNKWLSEILPNPEDVQCKVIYKNSLGTLIETIVSQKNLGLEPIDLLNIFHFDSDQAMTELDDRIMNFIRYRSSGTFSLKLEIKYLEPIEDKISFFELGALIKSLRKILIGNKFLSPNSMTLQTKTNSDEVFDAEQLLNRIESCKIKLDNQNGTLKSDLFEIVSINSISKDLKDRLKFLNLDNSKIEFIINQVTLDLKEFLSNPEADKLKIVANFKTTLVDANVGNAKITELATDYDINLDKYKNDFNKLDDLIKKTSKAFLKIALCNPNQMGIGFMHQAVAGIYDSVNTKLDKVINRWAKKKEEYDSLIAAYNSEINIDIKIEILQKAERKISSSYNYDSTKSLTENETRIKTEIEVKFSDLYRDLQALKNNSENGIITFISKTEAIISNISKFDLISFNIEKGKNDLGQEKIILALLKEDIVKALENATNYISKNLSICKKIMDEEVLLTNNTDKIKALLDAAKSIFGEDVLILPQFNLGATKTQFKNSFDNKEKILEFVKKKEHTLLPVEDWLSGVARVREKVHDLENIVFLSSGFTPNIKPESLIELKPLQFPYQANDRWLAMTFRNDDASNIDSEHEKQFENLSGDKLLYTAHFSNGLDVTKPVCGIVIDEWVEVIPSKEETTGITFHYDQPNSEPPQTMLLMVSPDFSENWQWENIIESMEETLGMAKKRAVEPAMVENSNYAQFLPSTLSTVTQHPTTISLNLLRNNANISTQINTK